MPISDVVLVRGIYKRTNKLSRRVPYMLPTAITFSSVFLKFKVQFKYNCMILTYKIKAYFKKKQNKDYWTAILCRKISSKFCFMQINILYWDVFY